ncbi:MAG: ubiquinone/menaquinone biosynthesis C-methylase UbiE, partial [Dinoroseobacter sp.]
MTATLMGRVHNRLVFDRRVQVLTRSLGALIPAGSHMLDVGTGDGQIAQGIA